MEKHPTSAKKDTVWKPTKVQHLYRHKNGRYYVRTYAGGKENWQSLRTTLLSVAKNRMKESLEAAEKVQAAGPLENKVTGPMLFQNALRAYREQLKEAVIQPSTRSFRDAGIKLVLRTWDGIEATNVRKITPQSVCRWLGDFKRNARPYIPHRAKSAARTSTGASKTTVKCALDSLRLVLDLAVASGHLYANPARHDSVRETASKIMKAANRERAERGERHIPTREQFKSIVNSIRSAGVSDCKAAADFVEFLAYSGARKTEAAHATWNDIDAERKNVQLRRTKNGFGRPIPVFAEMEVLLARLEQERVNPQPTDPILSVKEAQGFINSACVRLGIPRFTHHALRDLFGTTCLEAGVSVSIVAKWLGHRDGGALLLSRYARVRPEHEREMIKQVRFGVSDPVSKSGKGS